MSSDQNLNEFGTNKLLNSSILISLLIFFISCSSTKQHGYTINADIKGLEEQSAVLQYTNMTERKTVKLDSVQINNGSFTFEGTLESPRQLFVTTKPGGLRFSFYAENSNIDITGDVNDRGPRNSLNVNVSGSAINDDADAYQALLADMKKKAKPYRAAYDSLSKAYRVAKKTEASPKEIGRLDVAAENAKKDLEKATKDRGPLTKSFIRNHPDSHFAASLFVMRTNNHTYSKDLKIYENFSNEVQNGFYGKQIQDELNKLKKASPGAKAANFSTKDINGDSLALKDFRGQYVLLDFWASWCKPCRAESPHLKELYKKYHPQGFEIIGIADDDSSPDKWRKAVDQDGTGIWKHVLRGFKAKRTNKGYKIISKGVDSSYAIHTLPTQILINPKGKIIARYGGGGKDFETLDQKLSELFES